MKQNELFPKIRFKEFTNAWEQEKLGNLTILNRFPQISANQLKKINEYKGDIYLLPSSNNNDWKCRYNEKISHLINNAEIITVGRARNPNPKYVNGRFISSQNHIIESKMNDILTNKFLYFFICKVGRTFYSAASTYPMFTRVDFEDTILLFPLINEQHKILKTFNSIDSLITLHQRKLILLKNTKNRLLEKMFCDEKSEFPSIRFKEFTNAWEQEKLGNIVDRIIDKNSNLESSRVLTISQHRGLIDQDIFFNHRVASKNLNNYLFIKNDDFAYNRSISGEKIFGVIRRLKIIKMGLFPLYI
ncbi:restriction endonuclease subunit S [Mycoplasma mycoides]|uniref:restriction endonuclease subunit S n=1 Tax=Mycoplasma mycoides TaxID=2102 RepID=UPI00223EC037|nr:restriction endonuclease subunit S [Mycoplasma mycoides]QVK09411.1 restriction endonuclease subunit S [Mycoplasma mycoides subsp. capri]